MQAVLQCYPFDSSKKPARPLCLEHGPRKHKQEPISDRLSAQANWSPRGKETCAMGRMCHPTCSTGCSKALAAFPKKGRVYFTEWKHDIENNGIYHHKQKNGSFGKLHLKTFSNGILMMICSWICFCSSYHAKSWRHYRDIKDSHFKIDANNEVWI